MKKKSIYRFLFAGGGTGGHLYPALSVAQKVRQLKPESEIIFIGNKNKIESKVVPEYGFDFKSIWISGISRQITLSNLLFPIKLLVSMIQSLFIIIKFKPRTAIGSGAYVSGPPIWTSWLMGAKIILLEQNSYPGLTNRLLEKKASEIHLTFEESKKYFRQEEKLRVTGSPIRVDLKIINRNEAARKFGLDPAKKILLILGGSGGAGTINTVIKKIFPELNENGIQIIWQTGKNYYDHYKNAANELMKIFPFINDMTSAFSACDLIVARSGASTIAEVSMLGLPVIFVPSPFVAANHQMLNAKTICDSNAALMVEDKDIDNKLLETILATIFDEKKLEMLRNEIKKFSKPDAVKIIAENAIKLAELN
jgi:UDP-N-acetylglucosamine--N-acetylmuramyl-(pentapeptide) pyrophosphoryl-undecaprenol N-acetylglucosamine transferase